ncbi:MAG: hypothetical protein ABSA86_13425 [Oryzomonas sp.]|jgi:hypothetical protein
MNSVHKNGEPLSNDYIELLKSQRELALPTSRIASCDEFAKWLFTVTTVVGTLGAAFSNAAFKNLQGSGSILFFAAVAMTGVSLALAIILRTVEPKKANWQSLDDMQQKATDALIIKQWLALAAGVCFAVAIVLAGISPLASRDQTKDKPAIERNLSYSYGKDGLRITVVLPRPAQTTGEIRVFAITPIDEMLIAAQRAAADQQGALHLDVSTTSIPPTSTAFKITLICDLKDSHNPQEILLPLHASEGKLIPTGDPGVCFE